MRPVPATLAALLLLSGAARAGFDLPVYVFELDQLERAKAQAVSERKELTFVLSNPATSCPKAAAATAMAFEELKSRTVIVFFEWEERDLAPRLIREALASPEAGKFIPTTVVTDAEIREVICVIPYVEASKREELFREARRKIDNHAGSRPEEDPPPPPSAEGTLPPGFGEGSPSSTAAGSRLATTDPIVVVRWWGKLDPKPQAKLPGFFEELGYRFREMDAPRGEARWELQGTVFNEPFRKKLEAFLNSQFMVLRISTVDRTITVELLPKVNVPAAGQTCPKSRHR